MSVVLVSNRMVDARQYNLELLTSFDARSSDGRLLRPEDGIRWLQELVQTRPIVAVLVKLRVDRAHVIISDSLTGDEMERIPAPLVSQPSVCVGDRILAPHDNVLVFTVLEDTFHLAPPEMYFFQCLDCPVSSAVRCLDRSKAKARRRRGLSQTYLIYNSIFVTKLRQNVLGLKPVFA